MMAYLKDVTPDHPGMEELLNYFHLATIEERSRTNNICEA